MEPRSIPSVGACVRRVGEARATWLWAARFGGGARAGGAAGAARAATVGVHSAAGAGAGAWADGRWPAGAAVEGGRLAGAVVEGGRRAGGRGRRRRRAGISLDRAREKEREQRRRRGFKYSIFGGRVSWPPKITLISAAVSEAAENSVIFGGLLRPPKIPYNFRRPGRDRRK
jgi:hypothetical protein